MDGHHEKTFETPYEIAVQSELRRISSVTTSGSYLGPPSTNILEPRYKNVRNPCVQYFSAAVKSAALCFYTNGWCRQNNKRSTGMSSRALLAMLARQLPAGPFLSTHISDSHILNSFACHSSISHTSPLPLPSPLEIEVEMPWGKIAGLQWTIQQTNQQQVGAFQLIC